MATYQLLYSDMEPSQSRDRILDRTLRFSVLNAPEPTNYSNSSAIISAPPCQLILCKHIGSSHVKIWDVMILIPNVIFMAYLIMKLRYVITKLKKNDSSMFAVCFTLVGFANLISVLRCVISMSLQTDTEEIVDRVIWLLLKFFLLAIELSVIVFGFMFGHLDSRHSIQRVLAVTFAISLVYSFTQGALEFASPNRQFHNITISAGEQYNLYGHGGIVFWLVSSIVLSLVYLTICVLPWTGLRYRFTIPTRKSFYIYCFLLAVLNIAQTIGCVLLEYVSVPEGWCVIDATTYAYFTAFAPFLYLTFLRHFFAASGRPSVHFSYRSQVDDAQDESESSLPYPASSYGPPHHATSINYTDDFQDVATATGGGAVVTGTGWHDMLVGVPELKPSGAGHSRLFGAPTFMSRSATDTGHTVA